MLKPGMVMDWHSTRSREELLIVLTGRVRVETAHAGNALTSSYSRMILTSGQCALLPTHLLHRVVNPSSRTARYIYVTAPAP